MTEGVKGKAALFIFASLTSLVFCEIIVRGFIPQQLVRSYLMPDENLGYIIRPNQKCLDAMDGERSYHVRTNQDGFRMDQSVDPKKDKILALGDSFTFGWGMEIEKSYYDILRREIEFKNPGSQFLNAGVGGYSTGHVIKALIRHSSRLKIKKAVYFLNPNDLFDNVNTNKNYRVGSYDIDSDGEVTLRDEKVYSPFKRFLLTKTFYDWLNQHSHFFTLLKKTFIKSGDSVPIQYDINQSSAEADQIHKVSLAYLRKLAHLCDENKISLMIAWIPTQEDFKGVNLSYDKFKALIFQDPELQSCGVLVVDPIQEMRFLMRAEGLDVEDIVYRGDGHYNEIGSRLYAQSMLGPCLRFMASDTPKNNE